MEKNENKIIKKWKKNDKKIIKKNQIDFFIILFESVSVSISIVRSYKNVFICLFSHSRHERR